MRLRGIFKKIFDGKQPEAISTRLQEECCFTNSLVLGRLSPNPANNVMAYARDKISSGADIINMTQGEPEANATLPLFFREAITKAMADGRMTYGSAMNPFLRDDLSRYYSKHYSLDVPANEIFPVGSGSKSIFLSSFGLFKEGDEVLVLVPAWKNIINEIETTGAKVVQLPMGRDEQTGEYYVDDEMLQSAVTDKTRMIYSNSPNNPTGSILPLEQLEIINDFAKRNNLVWFSDEVYDRMTYDIERAPSALDIKKEDRSINCITFNSFSKYWGLTGAREGWVVASQKAESFFSSLVTNTNLCPNPLIQAGVRAALTQEGEEHAARQIQTYRANREVYSNWITANKKDVIANVPAGGFYGWVKIPDLKNSTALCMHMIDNGVAVAPGEPFGKGCDGYFRLCFAKDPETFGNALNRIESSIKSFKADSANKHHFDQDNDNPAYEI